MRKGFEGLDGLVRDRLLCEPLSGHVFLFSNARCNRLKMLFWDGSGWWVCPPGLAPRKAASAGEEPAGGQRECAFEIFFRIF